MKGISRMLKRIEEPTCNIYNGVEFILRGAKKRRSMAAASAKMLNNKEQRFEQKLVAVKQIKPKTYSLNEICVRNKLYVDIKRLRQLLSR